MIKPASSSTTQQSDPPSTNGMTNGRSTESSPAGHPPDGEFSEEYMPTATGNASLRVSTLDGIPARTESRRHVSENLSRTEGPSGDHEKRKTQRLSGGFLLQPFGSIRKKKRAEKPAVDQEIEKSSRSADVEADHKNGDLPKEEAATSHLPDFEHGTRSDGANDVHRHRYSGSPHSTERKGKARMAATPSPRASQDTPESSRSAKSRSTILDSPRDLNNRSSATVSSIDPSQIVRMALSLNEGRRLGLLPGQLPPSVSSIQRRVVSAGIPSSGALAESQPQRPSSAMLAGAFNRSTTASQRVSSKERPRNTSSSPSTSRPNKQSPLEYEPQTDFVVSAATMLRAEKAQAFFELCHEYRRVLQVLPPLKPASAGPRDDSASRPYNPLQYIRNRRIRTQERHTLDGEKDGWNNIDAVHSWVDSVESEARHVNYRVGDIAQLPLWHPPRGQRTSTTATSRAALVSSGENQTRRNRTEYMIDPADILADAYWLEQNSHKSLIEDRHGHKIFKRLQRPPEAKRGPGSPPQSYASPGTDEVSSPTSGYDSGLQKSPTSPRTDENDTDDGARLGLDGLIHSPTKTSYLKRRLLRRRKTVSDRGSSPSGDEDAASVTQNEHLFAGQHVKPNVGPLERHMRRMMEDDDRDSNKGGQQPAAKGNDKGQFRRGGVSEVYRTSFNGRQPSSARPDSYATTSPLSPRSSISSSVPGTPRISIEDYDRRPSQMNGNTSRPYSPASPVEVSKRKTRPFSMGFIHRRGKSKQQNGIAENDFAARDVGPKPGAFDFRNSSESERSSAGLSSRSGSHRSLVEHEAEVRRKSLDSQSTADMEATPRSPAATRFFKGGRIGEIVRSEVPRKADVVWKRHAPRQGSTDSSLAPQESQDDNNFLTTRQNRRSQSISSLQLPGRYQVPELPAFRSVNTPSAVSGVRPTTTESDHISRQQQATRDQKERRRSRFSKLAPLSTPADSDVSPNTSSPNLVEANGRSSQRDDHAVRSTSRSASSAVRKADQRLNKILGSAGGVGLGGGLPPTGLTALDPGKRRRSHNPHDWNIADEEKSSSRRAGSTTTLTQRDIAYVRSLLLSSGIKAQAIVQQANGLPPQPSDFHVRAHATAGHDEPFVPVSRRQEHVSAARLLSTHLERTVSAFEASADNFRNSTCTALATRVTHLHDVVGATLTPNVRNAADEADAFIARLTTTHSLAVKQVNDNIEGLLRGRWRRMRLLQRIGWAVLEWALVGFMWAIWLVVLLVRGVIGVGRGFAWIVKWLLWL